MYTSHATHTLAICSVPRNSSTTKENLENTVTRESLKHDTVLELVKFPVDNQNKTYLEQFVAEFLKGQFKHANYRTTDDNGNLVGKEFTGYAEFRQELETYLQSKFSIGFELFQAFFKNSNLTRRHKNSIRELIR